LIVVANSPALVQSRWRPLFHFFSQSAQSITHFQAFSPPNVRSSILTASVAGPGRRYGAKKHAIIGARNARRAELRCSPPIRSQQERSVGANCPRRRQTRSSGSEGFGFERDDGERGSSFALFRTYGGVRSATMSGDRLMLLRPRGTLATLSLARCGASTNLFPRSGHNGRHRQATPLITRNVSSVGMVTIGDECRGIARTPPCATNQDRAGRIGRGAAGREGLPQRAISSSQSVQVKFFFFSQIRYTK